MFKSVALTCYLIIGSVGGAMACTAENDCGSVCDTNCSPDETAACSNGAGCDPPSCACNSKMASFAARDFRSNIEKILLNDTDRRYGEEYHP